MDVKALVIGLGVSGKASAELLLSKGFSVTAADLRYEALKNDPCIQALMQRGVDVISDEAGFPLGPFSLVVVSPGIPPSHPLLQKAKRAGIEILGEIELALRHLPNRRILGVTGTNGKTTTVLLTAHILNAFGIKAAAVGNVGAALSGYALCPDQEEILVVELSSFQLESLSLKPWFDGAEILNITPNHLNRHASMEEYAEAKFRIGRCLKKDGQLWISNQVQRDFGVGKGAVIFDAGLDAQGGGEGVRKGGPERINCAAARALCSFCKVPEKFMEGPLKTFRKPPHRIEWVAEIDGIAYYNDSKASNVEAVIHGMALFPGPVILIAGGVDKGSTYAPWIKSFQGKTKRIVVFGEAAEKMERELGKDFLLSRVSTLEEAVAAVRGNAARGDTILFSPGCSSYDQFANYEERGDRFKKLIYGIRGG
jgi:UDP-N-acetylmuramoylalanine--D-glutamate ligase